MKTRFSRLCSFTWGNLRGRYAAAPFTHMDASLSLDAVLHHRRHPKSPPRRIPRAHLLLWQAGLALSTMFFTYFARFN
jgi:hypothetical protein